MDEPGAGAEERELAARRKELEREFGDKVRDLKAQDRRRAERLQQDREDWERQRREREKDLADRAERVRRQEENHKRDADALRVARRELEGAQAVRKEFQEKATKATSQASRVPGLAAELQATRRLLRAFAIVALIGSAAVIVAVALGSMRGPLYAAGATLGITLLLEIRRRSLVRKKS